MHWLLVLSISLARIQTFLFISLMHSVVCFILLELKRNSTRDRTTYSKSFDCFYMTVMTLVSFVLSVNVINVNCHITCSLFTFNKN